VVLFVFCGLPLGVIGGITLLGRSVTYTPTTLADGKVSFEIAGTPKRETRTKTSPSGQSYEVELVSTESGDDAFFVGTFVVPGAGESDELGELLEFEARNIAEAGGGSVTSTSDASFRGNPARSVDFQKGSVSGKCLTFAQGDRIVDACAYTTGSLQEKYQRLLDSLQVKS
jgi:hypothetical protein